jgi:hypothetical protein
MEALLQGKEIFMTQRLTYLLTFVLLLNACAPSSPPPAPTQAVAAQTQADPTAKRDPATATATVTRVPSATSTPKSTRTASFAEVNGLVEMRASQKEEFAAATPGAAFSVGGEARTGQDGKARLNLLPDGTILRLAPNSSFTLADLSGDEANPFTRLELLVGKIFIILTGGELEVQTPSGVASVRGSMLGVSFDPVKNIMSAMCAEGHCSLKNDSGVIELTAGQAADIRNGVLSSAPRSITDAEWLDWIQNVPEVETLINRFPRLQDLIKKLKNKPPHWPP